MTSLPIAVLALGGAALMVISRCLRLDEAFRLLSTSTLFLLAGTIPLGLAMQDTGLAQLIVDTLVRLLADAPHVVFISIFYLLTSLLTELLSNNAVAVLLTPIAYSLSHHSRDRRPPAADGRRVWGQRQLHDAHRLSDQRHRHGPWRLFL